MRNRSLEELARSFAQLSIIDDAIQKMTAANKLFEVDQLTAKLREQSTLGAMSDYIAESQELSQSLFNTAIQEKRLAQQLAAISTIQHDRLLETLGRVDSVVEASKRALGATLDYATQEAARQANVRGVAEQFTRELDFRHYSEISALSLGVKDFTEDIRSRIELLEGGLGQAVKDIINSYSLTKQAHFDTLQAEISQQTVRLEAIYSIAFPPTAALAKQVLDVFHLQVPAMTLQESFSGELLGRLQRFENATSDAEPEAIVEDLLVWLLERFRELPRSFPSWVTARDVFWSIIAPVVLHFILNHNSVSKTDLADMEHRLDNNLTSVEQYGEKNTQLLEEVLRELAEIRPIITPHRNHIVTKRVQMREKPTAKAKAIQVLFPNIVVEEIDKQEDWLLVEFLDYTDLKLKRGWVNGKHLKLIQNSDVD